MTALQTLLRRANISEEKNQVDRIYKNMRPTYKLYIPRGSVTTVTDLTRRGETFEKIQKLEEAEGDQDTPTKVMNPPTTRTQNIEIAAAEPPYERSKSCWQCKQRGHSRRACRNPKKLFCSYCGKDGISFTRCPCPKPENFQGVAPAQTGRPN